jgi:hypothetical protein
VFLAIAVDNLSTDGDEEEGGGDEPAVDAADIVLGMISFARICFLLRGSAKMLFSLDKIQREMDLLRGSPHKLSCYR